MPATPSQLFIVVIYCISYFVDKDELKELTLHILNKNMDLCILLQDLKTKKPSEEQSLINHKQILQNFGVKIILNIEQLFLKF
jgi:hypothetical protein